MLINDDAIKAHFCDTSILIYLSLKIGHIVLQRVNISKITWPIFSST